MEGFLLMLVIMILIVALTTPSAPKKQANGKLVIQKKKCPPHKWSWQEIVDQDGNKLGERIVCQACGPLASQSGRDDEGRTI